MHRKAIGIIVTLAITGCARVPTEVKTAMEKQAKELQQIKSAQKDSVEILFAQIRALQLYILSEKEKEFQARYSRGPKALTLDDHSQVITYSDPSGKPLPPSGNPNVDVIAISTNTLITDWFDKKRTDSEQQLNQTKAEFLKVQDHVQIAIEINQAVSDYLDSLINLHRAQSELGNSLLKRVSSIPGVGDIQKNLLNIFVPDTKDLETRLQPKV